MKDREISTSGGVARLLRVSRKIAMDWMRSGEIKSWMVGKHLRALTSDVLEFAKRKGIPINEAVLREGAAPTVHEGRRRGAA